MSEKQGRKRDTRASKERRAQRRAERKDNPNPDRDLGGRPPKGTSFAEILRKHLFKRKKFRRADGSLMETSEIELIAIKVIRQLRTEPEVSHRLLNAVLDRIDGKPKESIDIDATVQTASGIDARDALLQRLERFLDLKEEEEDDDEVEDDDDG